MTESKKVEKFLDSDTTTSVEDVKKTKQKEEKEENQQNSENNNETNETNDKDNDSKMTDKSTQNNESKQQSSDNNNEESKTNVENGNNVSQMPSKNPFFHSEEINSKIKLFHGNIISLEVDAIVNAANSGLWAGGGVCGVIFRGSGAYGTLQAECEQILDDFYNGKKVPTGRTVLTNGYKLLANYIMHTVGPVGTNKKALQSCYWTILELAYNNGIKSVAIPCISTGIFGYPNDDACHTALHTVRVWLNEAKKTKYKKPKYPQVKNCIKWLNNLNKKKKSKKKNWMSSLFSKDEESDSDNEKNKNTKKKVIKFVDPIKDHSKFKTKFDAIENIIFVTFMNIDRKLYLKWTNKYFPNKLKRKNKQRKKSFDELSSENDSSSNSSNSSNNKNSKTNDNKNDKNESKAENNNDKNDVEMNENENKNDENVKQSNENNSNNENSNDKDSDGDTNVKDKSESVDKNNSDA